MNDTIDGEPLTIEERIRWIIGDNYTRTTGNDTTDWVEYYESKVPFDFDSVIVFCVFMVLLIGTVNGIKIVERRSHRYAALPPRRPTSVELATIEVDEITPGTDEDIARRADV